MNDFSRFEVSELRTLAQRIRTLMLTFYLSLLARVLITLVATTFHLDTRLVAFASLLITVWVAFFFFRFAVAAKLPFPWLYLLSVVIVSVLLPSIGLLLVALLVLLVNLRVFRARGIPIGPLGPDERAIG
ncbi:hypothetical protein [Deinococcus ruber]|uniref:Uncharacterized protein n=1 Tax=Deinococcus ruber TaxID=1848197 RepID=A0A918FAL4_9DEIO|nr:hypothetical protein [Deinococcus ruber]GGR21588.1 hypothetical protein GCM10008957_37300 [Deinococcus ruber]